MDTSSLFAPNVYDIVAWSAVAVGVGLNLWGAAKTWKANARRNDHLWPALARLRSRKDEPIHHQGSATATIGISGTADGHRGFNSLPPMEDAEAFSKAVNDRLSELYAQVHVAKTSVLDEVRETRSELAEAKRELSASVSGVSSEVESVWARVQAEFLGAVRLEIFGSVLVICGLVANVAKALLSGS
ncbi:hypothetical protein ACFW4K_01555 [Nocardiopsis alba]|uniref:hypothetical protein n=1 Tax=Nocardiopsis alba TaxID=53437 RepID=UPI003672E1E3